MTAATTTVYRDPAVAPISHTTARVDEIPSKLRDIPAQDLLYRPHETPVTPERIPRASGPPPIQTAGYEVPASHTPQGNVSPLTTNSVGQPAPPATLDTHGDTPTTTPPVPSVLDAETEADVVRLRELSTQYWRQPELRAIIGPELNQLATKVYFSPQPHYMPPHRVAPGEQLRLIAGNYRVTWQYLARLNQVAPEAIRIDQELKVLTGPFDCVVDLSDRELTVHAHGYFVRAFPIGIGRDGKTPTGTFPVLNKVANPTYYGPDGVISANDPANPLGEHWIDLGNSIGIHGTIHPESIGTAASKGCIRMHADAVALVFDLLTTESTVIIRE